MNLRLKLRKNQSTIPSEKLTQELHSLEILGESIQSLPPLSHLIECRYLMISCPELTEFPSLPENLEILKIRGGHFGLDQELSALKQCRILNLMGIKNLSPQIVLPPNLETLDLSANELNCLPSSLINLNRLARLTLDSNQISELPAELFQMKSLNHLSLDHNPLSEETKQKLHEAFGLWF